MVTPVTLWRNTLCIVDYRDSKWLEVSDSVVTVTVFVGGWGLVVEIIGILGIDGVKEDV